MNSKLRLVLAIYGIQLKVSALTFGGGLAMVPYFHREFVSRRRWLEEDEFASMVSNALACPGPLAINFSLMVGHRLGGKIGAALALLGVSSPGIINALLLAVFLLQYMHVPAVGAFMKGAGLAVVGLLCYAAWMLGRRLITSRRAILLSVATVLAIVVFRVNPLLVLIAATAVELLFLAWRRT